MAPVSWTDRRSLLRAPGSSRPRTRGPAGADPQLCCREPSCSERGRRAARLSPGVWPRLTGVQGPFQMPRPRQASRPGVFCEQRPRGWGSPGTEAAWDTQPWPLGVLAPSSRGSLRTKEAGSEAPPAWACGLRPPSPLLSAVSLQGGGSRPQDTRRGAHVSLGTHGTGALRLPAGRTEGHPGAIRDRAGVPVAVDDKDQRLCLPGADLAAQEAGEKEANEQKAGQVRLMVAEGSWEGGGGPASRWPEAPWRRRAPSPGQPWRGATVGFRGALQRPRRHLPTPTPHPAQLLGAPA